MYEQYLKNLERIAELERFVGTLEESTERRSNPRITEERIRLESYRTLIRSLERENRQLDDSMARSQED